MRMLLIAAAACLALAGCTTTSVDTAIQRNLPQICSAATTAHVAFVAVAAAGSIPERTVKREAVAWAALQPLCADPANATTGNVLVAAANAYAVIAAALAEAERKS